MKVLVVDTIKYVQTVFESEFHQQNIEVELASSSQEALDLIKKGKPDLIILELILPVMNGFDFIVELKKNKKNKDIPIIVYSRLGQKKDIDEASSLGITKYFPKEDYSQKQVIQESLNILMSLFV